ncbi:MAG: heavy metal-responsive transcriptional regulator [Gemmatimonadaceae bacterium]
MKPLLVGEAARAVGVGVQTLHFYEREGLIPPPARSASGYRMYDAREIDRIRFIRKAQALGLPLHEIKHVLALAARGTSPCGRVQAALAEKLADVDRRLVELQSFRDELARLTEGGLLNKTEDDTAQICAIVEGSPSVMPRRPDGLRSRRVMQVAQD